MVQEVHDSNPPIRDACAGSFVGHAATLETDIAEALEKLPQDLFPLERRADAQALVPCHGVLPWDRSALAAPPARRTMAAPAVSEA